MNSQIHLKISIMILRVRCQGFGNLVALLVPFYKVNPRFEYSILIVVTIELSKNKIEIISTL